MSFMNILNSQISHEDRLDLINNSKLDSLNDLSILWNEVTANKVIIKSRFENNKGLNSDLGFDLNCSNNFLTKSRFSLYRSVF